MPIPLYTYNNLDNEKNIPLGAVIGKHAEAISVARGAVAGIKAIFGGKASEIEKKVKDTTDGAMDDFIKQLDKEYPKATAVIGLTIQVSEMAGFIIALVTGTAIANKSSNGGFKKTLKNKHK